MQRIVFCLLFFCSALGFSQKDDNKIPYEEDRMLVWDDFKGAADPGKPFQASTNSGISFSWSLKSSKEGSEFIYEVVCSFHLDLSWVKEGSRNDHLLAHEQLHFDITELHAREFRKALKHYQVNENVKKDLNRLYKKNEQARRKMQRDFDAETRHSQDKQAQERWQETIQTALAELHEFSL